MEEKMECMDRRVLDLEKHANVDNQHSQEKIIEIHGLPDAVDYLSLKSKVLEIFHEIDVKLWTLAHARYS